MHRAALMQLVAQSTMHTAETVNVHRKHFWH